MARAEEGCARIGEVVGWDSVGSTGALQGGRRVGAVV